MSPRGEARLGVPTPGPRWNQLDDRRGAVRRVLWLVLFANLAVIAAKLLVGWRSGSIAILGDAAHSGTDALNNVVGLLAVRLAAAPPDEDHPYGHGKFETLGAFAVVAFLSVTCFELLLGSLRRLLGDAGPPTIDSLVFQVLLSAMVVNVAVAWGEARYARKLESEMLSADARHTAADVMVTVAVLGGMVLVRGGWSDADAWLGIVVALLIAYSGIQILRHTIPVLVDQRAFDADRIRVFVRRLPGVLDATEIRSRGRRGEAFAELTIRVDADSSLRDAHEIADEVERRLGDEGGFYGVVVHVEPAEEEVGSTPADRDDGVPT
jgi:cation diffusion facilitator family transporter